MTKQTLKSWLKKHPTKTSNKAVNLFNDEFTNFYDTEIGVNAVILVKKLGYQVKTINHDESGRSHISKGFLKEAKEVCNNNIAVFKDVVTDETPYAPSSPYSASKSSSDHLIRGWQRTYGLPTLITNCSNNYGPFQFPEKLIPLFINNIVNNKLLPVYGKGENVRDWLFVDDHARAIDVIFHDGKLGETYNIGGFNEWKNIDLIKVMIKTVDRLLEREEGASDKLITYVTDRAGHDLRYAIDSSKLKNELGWEPSLQFEEGIEKTVKWYLDNQEWLNNVTSGDYQAYYQKMYTK